ncbi:hypothetical protein [Actinomadura rugatobispora]|uniref:Uncharacterized protein n=1 Tax=Actinomadura rugatobispora TaxID=1994 RepID=A0ABW1AGN4_9ACTN
MMTAGAQHRAADRPAGGGGRGAQVRGDAEGQGGSGQQVAGGDNDEQRSRVAAPVGEHGQERADRGGDVDGDHQGGVDALPADRAGDEFGGQHARQQRVHAHPQAGGQQARKRTRDAAGVGQQSEPGRGE